jgi:thiol-disulfide isomerase/thioredoxin
MIRTRTTRAVFAAALLVILPAIARGAAAPDPLDRSLRNFEASGDNLLVIDGKPVPEGTIYKNTKLPAFILVAPTLPAPVLLRPHGNTVEAVPAEAISHQEDGTIGVLANAELQSLGEYKVAKDGTVSFAYQARHVAISSKPALTGLHVAADLAANDPAYVRGAAAYEPDATAIAALRAPGSSVTVRVFFGSWCPHCQQLVPHMLKVEQALAGSRVSVEYFGLGRPPDGFKDPEAKKMQVSGVPTGIVYVDGKKVGRLLGEDWDKPEVELSRIVARAESAG